MEIKDNMKFEEALELLEKQVKNLESGNMTIDEALASYEDSIKLVKICNDKLEAAENRIRILTEAADGSITDAPFSDSDDAS